MSNRDKDAAMRFPAHCDLSPARVGMRVITKASRWDEKLQLILLSPAECPFRGAGD